jgi:hypothetical protein
MALDAAHRASIYEKLRPILGDEDANVLMSEFPSVEAHELVTKDFLRAELALTRGELREELALTKGELRAELAEVRSEMGALETRLTVRLGSAIAASTALLATIGLLA